MQCYDLVDIGVASCRPINEPIFSEYIPVKPFIFRSEFLRQLFTAAITHILLEYLIMLSPIRLSK